MVSSKSRQLFIQGVTSSGRTFRPSDWAERLAGVMSQFRPGGASAQAHRASYSPWCVPSTLGTVKCVIVHRDMEDEEPMAWAFCMNFAKDNDLTVLDGDQAAALAPASTPSPR